jgi:dienelactone hydrolase
MKVVRRYALPILLALAPPGTVLGQSGAPVGGERVEFMSLDQRLGPEKVFGYLYLPAGASDGRKVAAMVVVHGSGGARDTREGDYGRGLSSAGIAALAIDAFSPRGVSSTVEDQSRVTTGQMIRDAFGALAFLSKHPAIDPARIGVMGMSKGGAVAMQVADPREQAEARKRMGVGGFAAHVPIYPGCSTQYRSPRMAAPMLVLIGADDDYTGVKACAEYLERIRAGGGKAELKTYPGAVHGFDGDTSTRRHFWIAAAQNFRDCVFYVEDDGRFVTRAGTPFDPNNVAATIALARRECMRQGATVGADAGAKAQALADIKAFLKTHLGQ